MSAPSISEAQDLQAFATQASARLNAALAHFDEFQPNLSAERDWLVTAAERLNARLERLRGALAEAAPLPEFASSRKAKAETLSNEWVDAIEQVFDSIVANVSGNGPLIEALFPHQRFAALRRPGTAAHSYWLEFERRAESSYVKRLCGDPEYQFLPPLLESAKQSQRSLREAASPRPLPEAQAEKLRAAVAAAAEALEQAVRQARSLAEAAFAATPSAVSELGLDAKPKRRALQREPAKLASNHDP